MKTKRVILTPTTAVTTWGLSCNDLDATVSSLATRSISRRHSQNTNAERQPRSARKIPPPFEPSEPLDLSYHKQNTPSVELPI